MKNVKWILGLIMMFSVLLTSAQNESPLGWGDGGSFPFRILQLKKTENPIFQKGDIVYSAFMVDGKLYASAADVFQNRETFVIRALPNANVTVYDSITGKITFVKTGFDVGDEVIWGVWRDGIFNILELQYVYKEEIGVYAIFGVTMDEAILYDNPWFSVNPEWPTNLKYKIKKPTATNKTFYLYNLAYSWDSNMVDWRMEMPKYITGLKWEMVEGTTKITNDKRFLNQAKFRFTSADINKGYIRVRMIGTPLKNSKSTNVSRIYTIYW